MPSSPRSLSRGGGPNGRSGAKTLRTIAHGAVDSLFTRLGGASWVVVVAIGALSALLLTVAGFDGWESQRPWMVVVGIAAYVVAAVIAGLAERDRRAEAAEQTSETADGLLAVSSGLDPVLRELGRLQNLPSDQRAEPLQKVVAAVLQSMPILFPDVNDVRMVVFRHERRQGRKPKLVVESWNGRTREPGEFKSGDDGRGDAVFTWLASAAGEPRFVPNTDEEQEDDWKGTGAGYRTFISVPIVVRDDLFGMLTVDAPSPGDLDETDLPILKVLARCLAIAYACARR